MEQKLTGTTRGTVCAAAPSQGETAWFFHSKKKTSLLVCFRTNHFFTALIAATTREHQLPLWNLINMTCCLVISNFWFHPEKGKNFG